MLGDRLDRDYSCGTILVTGAGGFVGSHVAEGLIALGHSVTGLDMSFDAATKVRLAGACLVERALTAQGLSALGRFDTIIHAAAFTTPPEPSGLTPAAHALRNIEPLLTTLGFATASQACGFVFLSSSGVFKGSTAEWLVESTPACATTAYGIAKRTGETLLALAPASLRSLSVRLGQIYGPFERSRQTSLAVSPVRRWLDAAAIGLPIAVCSPRSRRDWTYAPDLAGAIDIVLTRTRLQGVLHLCSPGAVTDAALAHQISRLSGASVVESPETGLPRRPMTSERLNMAELIAWTPLETGLARVHADQGPK